MSKKNVTITLTRDQAYNLLSIVRNNLYGYNIDKEDRNLYLKDLRIARKIEKAIVESEAEG